MKCIWNMCDKDLLSIQEDIERLIETYQDETITDQRLRLVAIDLTRVISVLRFICQENSKE